MNYENETLTLQQVAEKLGTSCQNVFNIQTRALEKVRYLLQLSELQLLRRNLKSLAKQLKRK